MAELPAALELRLRKIKPLAPPFHEHIVRGKLRGKVVRQGDRAVVYDVVETVPAGPVVVTEETDFHFE